MSKVEVVLGAAALLATAFLFLWLNLNAQPGVDAGHLFYRGSEPEPLAFLALLIFLVGLFSVMHGLVTSMVELALGTMISVWSLAMLGWLFQYARYQSDPSGNVIYSFAWAEMLFFAAIGLLLEVALIIDGIRTRPKVERIKTVPKVRRRGMVKGF